MVSTESKPRLDFTLVPGSTCPLLYMYHEPLALWNEPNQSSQPVKPTSQANHPLAHRPHQLTNSPTHHRGSARCVFDGHGEHGHHVSKICRERLAQLWIEQEWSMPRSFRLMQAELDKCNVDVRCSGATGTCYPPTTVVVAATDTQFESQRQSVSSSSSSPSPQTPPHP